MGLSPAPSPRIGPRQREMGRMQAVLVWRMCFYFILVFPPFLETPLLDTASSKKVGDWELAAHWPDLGLTLSCSV